MSLANQKVDLPFEINACDPAWGHQARAIDSIKKGNVNSMDKNKK
jgi:hypothetical protein